MALPVPETSFIGRTAEKRELRELLHEHRLVTIAGPGGCGKTRLAIEVAHAPELRAEFVDLSAVRDGDAVASIVDGLDDVLEPGPALLVLDNCEQVVAAVRERLRSLLREIPALKVLATSREPLGLPGERVWTMPPLPQEESLELFAERARLGGAPFSVTNENSADVANLCRAFEGLPLGIELAAAWAPLIGLSGIQARMGARLDVLSHSPHAPAPRHQSLRAAIEWSEELLEPEERRLWWRLGVFAPPFDLDAAEAVCEGTPALLRRLIERSLVQPQVERGTVTRYRLLDIVRDFCRDRLAANGELEDIAARHAAHYVALAEEGFRHRDAPDLSSWAERMTAEHPNVRAALDWLHLRDREAELRLAGAMGWVWGARELLPEGRRLLERAIEGSTSSTWFAARASRAAGILALEHGDEKVARARLAHALALHGEQGDEGGQAIVLARMGMLESDRALLERAVELGERSGERTAMVVALANLAAMDLERGSPRSARTRYEQAVALCREMGHARWLPEVLGGLAHSCVAAGDARAGRAAAAEAVTLAERSKLLAVLPSLLETAAEAASASSMPERALRLAGAAAAMRGTVTAAPHEWPQALAESLANARRAVPGAADALLAEGERMRVAEAVALARAGSVEPPLPTSAVRISRRQAQVAALVAGGLTNAQIASRLAISERTAEWHVEELRNRLGFTSRSQIAAWAARQGLDGTERRK